MRYKILIVDEEKFNKVRDIVVSKGNDDLERLTIKSSEPELHMVGLDNIPKNFYRDQYGFVLEPLNTQH